MVEFWVIGLFAFAFAASYFLVPIVKRIAEIGGFIDHSHPDSFHAESIPRLGGLAVVLAVGLSMTLVATVDSEIGASVSANRSPLCLAISLALIAFLGVYDDRFGSDAKQKLAVQILAGVILIVGGWRLDTVAIPFLPDVPLGVMGPVVTLLWIVAVVNAVNLIDGLDGLAVTTGAVACIGLAIIAVLRHEWLAFTLLVSLSGALLGFLPSNWYPAKIFLGDTGSLLIGYILALASIELSGNQGTAFVIGGSTFVLLLPLFDMFLVAIRRFTKSADTVGDRVFRVLNGDRSHAHYILYQSFKDQRKVVISLTILTAVFALSGVLTDPSLGLVRWRFMSPLALGCVVAGCGLSLLLGLHWSERGSSAHHSPHATSIDEKVSPNVVTIWRNADGQFGASSVDIGEPLKK